MSCEHCWSRTTGVEDYHAMLRQAEREGWPCTKNDENGARLRAGQFWDEAAKRDTRLDPITPPTPETPRAN